LIAGADRDHDIRLARRHLPCAADELLDWPDETRRQQDSEDGDDQCDRGRRDGDLVAKVVNRGVRLRQVTFGYHSPVGTLGIQWPIGSTYLLPAVVLEFASPGLSPQGQFFRAIVAPARGERDLLGEDGPVRLLDLCKMLGGVAGRT